MPKVTVTARYYFREIGHKADAGETIELSKEAVEEYDRKHPGLLRKPKQTMQKKVQATQSGKNRRVQRRK